MNEEIITTAPEIAKDVAKTSLPQLANSVYQDLLSPGMKKAGIALANVVDFASLLVVPLEIISEKVRMNVSKNLKSYQRKLDAVPENEIRNVEPEIGVPIVEKLSYTTCEEIAEMYTTLLAKASTTGTIGQAHPAFVQFLERMSVDEGRILKYLDGKKDFVCVCPRYYREENGGFIEIDGDITEIEDKVQLLFPQNINSYIDNLCSIGIIIRKTGNHFSDEALYERVIKKGENKAAIYKLRGLNFAKVSYDKSYYEVTTLGRTFIKACLTPISSK